MEAVSHSVDWTEIRNIPYDIEGMLVYWRKVDKGAQASEYLEDGDTLSDVKQVLNDTVLCELQDTYDTLVDLYTKLGIPFTDATTLEALMAYVGLSDGNCIADTENADMRTLRDVYDKFGIPMPDDGSLYGIMETLGLTDLSDIRELLSKI